MRVLVAGATGAIGRPLIRGLKQHGHSVFGFARSAKSTRVLTEMGAEAVIGDALDAASVQAAIARVRPDAVINELTHCRGITLRRR
jgi:2-alkyl-3-oxoalkanoate reductase